MASTETLIQISKALDTFLEKAKFKTRVRSSLVRLMREHEKKMRPEVNEFLELMIKEIRKGLSKLRGKKAKDIKRLADWDYIKEEGARIMKPALLDALVAGGDSVVRRKIVKQERFDPIGVGAVGWADKHAAKLVTMISEETEKAIRAYVAEGIKRGKSIPKIAREMRPLIGLTKKDMLTVANYEEWLIVNRPEYTMKTIREMADTRGRRYIRRRGELIAKTETRMALDEGTLQGYGQMGVTKVDRVEDAECCEECAEIMAGGPYTMEEARGFDFHPGCLPGNSLISPRGRITSISKRWYDGEVIIIKTASKRKLTCTPNHPILSDRGFYPANSLDIGSHVVSDGLGQRESFGYWKNVNKPTSIQEIAESFLKDRKMMTCEVPVTAPDFHNDGIGSKVAIISTNRFLMNGFNPSFRQHFLNLQFKMRKVRRLFFDCLSVLTFSFPRDLFSNGRFMRSLDLMITLRLRHMIPKVFNSFALSSNLNIFKLQTLTDNISGNMIFSSKLFLRPSRDIQIDNFFGRKIDVAEFSESIPNTFLDKIIHIETSSYHGYVYNLETTKSYYIANGIANHNCEGVWVAA